MRVNQLSEMCELIVDCPHFTPEWTEEGFIVVRNQNIKNGRLDLSQPSFTSEIDFKRRVSRAKPQPGDLILTREAPMGEVCLIPEGVECCLGQRQVLLRSAAGVEPRYLFYALRSEYVQRQILWNQGTGSTVSNVRIPILKAIQIPRLGRHEESIARLLGALDEKIEANRRMNETLETMARVLFRDWFIDFGPTRAKMQGRDPYLASDVWSLFPARLADTGIPEEWGVSTVSEEFQLLMGQSPPGDTYNDVENGLPFFQGSTDFGFRFPTNRKYCSAPTRVAKRGDTLVSVRAPVGDVNQAASECCIGRGLAAIRHNSGSQSFTYYSAWAIRDQLEAFEGTGTVFGSISKKQFEKLRVVAVEQQTISSFERIVSCLDTEIAELHDQAKVLSSLRDLLLPRLMSGALRIRDAERMVEAAV